MTRMKRRYRNLSKGLIPSNQSLEAEAEAKLSSLNKNQKIHRHKHKRINTIMRILTIITIMRIIGASPEVADPIEDKIQDTPLEVKIFVVEVKEIRIHTKANIKMMVIKAIITRVIEDFIIIHIETSLKVIVTVNQEAEAVAMAGSIIEAMLITNIISIMFMMMSTRHQYGSPCTLCSGYNHSPKHCFKGEHDINDIMEKMNINGHQSQSSSLYS